MLKVSALCSCGLPPDRAGFAVTALLNFVVRNSSSKLVRGGSDAVTAAARAKAPLETAAAGQAGAGKGAVVSRAGGSCHGSASLTCTTTVGLRRQGGGLVNRKYLSSPHAHHLLSQLAEVNEMLKGVSERRDPSQEKTCTA